MNPKFAMINSASWDIREGFSKGGPAEDLPTLQIFEAILPAAQSSSRRLAHSPENGEKITMDISKVEDDLSFLFKQLIVHFSQESTGDDGDSKDGTIIVAQSLGTTEVPLDKQ